MSSPFCCQLTRSKIMSKMKEANVIVVVQNGTVTEILKKVGTNPALVIEVIDLDGDLEDDKSKARVDKLYESPDYMLEGFD